MKEGGRRRKKICLCFVRSNPGVTKTGGEKGGMQLQLVLVLMKHSDIIINRQLQQKKRRALDRLKCIFFGGEFVLFSQKHCLFF